MSAIAVDSIHLACQACGQRVVVPVDVREITPDNDHGGVAVRVSMTRAGLDWLDAHLAPYVVPRPICGEV